MAAVEVLCADSQKASKLAAIRFATAYPLLTLFIPLLLQRLNVALNDADLRDW